MASPTLPAQPANVDAAELVSDAIRRLNPQMVRDPYPYKVNNVLTFVDALRRWAVTSHAAPRDGVHRITVTQLGRFMWDGVESYGDGGKAKTSSVKRWAEVAQEAGLIEWRSSPGHWFEFRLVSVPDVCLGSRPCSSAGSSNGRWQRRRETPQQRHERRVAPFRRRGGRAAVGRLFLGPKELSPPGPGGKGIGPLGGASPLPTQAEQLEQTRASAPGHLAHPPRPAAAADDPIRRACPADAAAALASLRSTLTEEGGTTPSGAWLGSGVPLEALALALWEVRCPGQEPRLSRAAAAQLRRSGQQLDRLWGPGAAAQLVADTFADVRQGVDHGGDLERLESLAWLVRIVKATARDAVAGYRRRRGTRANGRGQVDHRDGTWTPRGRR